MPKKAKAKRKPKPERVFVDKMTPLEGEGVKDTDLVPEDETHIHPPIVSEVVEKAELTPDDAVPQAERLTDAEIAKAKEKSQPPLVINKMPPVDPDAPIRAEDVTEYDPDRIPVRVGNQTWMCKRGKK